MSQAERLMGIVRDMLEEAARTDTGVTEVDGPDDTLQQDLDLPGAQTFTLRFNGAWLVVAVGLVDG